MANSAGDGTSQGANVDGHALPVLDTNLVIADMGQDRDAYSELAEVFLIELPKTLSALERASAGANPAALLALIHEACNSLGVIGAMRGAAQTRALERRWRQGEPVPTDQASEIVRSALLEAETALTQWLENGSPPSSR